MVTTETHVDKASAWDELTKKNAEIERLRAHQDETAKAWTKLTESQEQEIERLAWSSADLTQKNARLRAALKPLAALPLWRDHYSDGPDILNTSATVKYYFTSEHVRAARAAMNEQIAVVKED